MNTATAKRILKKIENVLSSIWKSIENEFFVWHGPQAIAITMRYRRNPAKRQAVHKTWDRYHFHSECTLHFYPGYTAAYRY